MMNFFDRVNATLRNTERSLVNFISMIAPWGAPLAPAYMAFWHMQNSLGFPTWVALILSGVIEILGLSTVSTILASWNYNRRSAQANRVPLTIPVAAFLFYLTVVLVLNVLLELPTQTVWNAIAARGILTLLSIPAALILAFRTMHYEMIEKIQADKAERKASRVRTQTDNVPKVVQPKNAYPVFHVTERSQLTAEMETHLTNGHSPKELATMFPQVSSRTIRRWKESVR